MLKHVSPSDWMVYIALGKLIIYIARDSVYVPMCACRCSHLCETLLCLLLSLHHYSALSQPPFWRLVIIQTVPARSSMRALFHSFQ